MSESAGILIEVPIAQAKLTAFFKRKIPSGADKTTVGHMLSELLERGDPAGDILIVHHEPESETLFLAWILNHYAAEAIAPLWPILEALAAHMEPASVGKGCVASVYPECLESLRIEDCTLSRGPAELVSLPELAELSNRLWSFSSKKHFPEAAKSMQRRNYQCRPFKTAWKNYRKWRDEQERPALIAAATEANPYRLVEDAWCWNGKVFERDSYTKRDILFPGADPLTFRVVMADVYADKNHVWQRRLAKDSPPREIKESRGTINNPAAIWEYHIIEGAIGADFTWFDERWDTSFWTDKRRIYARDKERLELLPLPDVDASGFRMYGQCFGTDGRAVFFHTLKLPLRVDALQTDGFFIWDDKRVFFADFELPLDAGSFRILASKGVPGMVGKQFRLADAGRTVVLGPRCVLLPDDPDF